MKLLFTVTGMSCAACSARVEKVSKLVPGVKMAEVNLLAGTMVVEAENESVIDKIIQAVSDAGYGATIQKNKVTKIISKADTLKEIKQRVIFSAVFLIISPFALKLFCVIASSSQASTPFAVFVSSIILNNCDMDLISVIFPRITAGL